MASRNVNLVVAHEPDMSGDWVSEHIPPDDGMVVKEVLDSLSPDSEQLRASEADLLVVACSEDSDDAIDLIHWWREHRQAKPVVVLCQNSPNGFVQRAFTAGADDLVVLEPGIVASSDSIRHVSFALEKAMVRRRTTSSDGETARATIVCVLGPKGGNGKTVASCNLAAALALRRKKVVLVDLDLQFGDDSLSLGLRPDATIYDLFVAGGSLDADKVDAFLTVHPTGLRVLAAPVRPDQAGVITPEFTTEVLTTLRGAYDFVVIDTPPGFSPHVIASIDISTYVCMVGMLDALSLKNTRLGLETLDLMGYPADRIKVVLNRANTSVGITGPDVVSILGRNPEVLVPSSRDVVRSLNEGEPVVVSQKRSDVARAFVAAADLFAPAAVPIERKRRNRTLLGRSRD